MPPAIIAAGIMGGTSLFGGAMANRSAKKAQDAQNRMMQPVLQRQSALANEISQFSRGQASIGGPAMNKALQYYMGLAGGNNALMQQHLSPQISMLNQQYGGAERGLMNRMAPGAQRDQALASLTQQKVGQMGQMGIQGRQNAVAGLADMGQNFFGNALQGYGAASSVLGGQGNQQLGLAQLQHQQRMSGQQNVQNMGMNIGRILLPYIMQAGGGSSSGGNTGFSGHFTPFA